MREQKACGCRSDWHCPKACRLWLEVHMLYSKAAAYDYWTVECQQGWRAYLEKHLEYDRHINNQEAIARLTEELEETKALLARIKAGK